MGKRIDLTGQTINGVHVDSFAYAGGGKAKKAYWNCTCSCGNKFVVESLKLRSGHTKSCGCLRKKTTQKLRWKHGETSGGEKSRLYKIWVGIENRCACQSSIEYKNYGGRGIKRCDEWNDYPTFKRWALEHGYNDGLTIERIDVNGDYCPDNCCWIPLEEQALNKTNTHWITYNGVTKPLKAWCDELGYSVATISSRLKRGWSPECALSVPALNNKTRTLHDIASYKLR